MLLSKKIDLLDKVEKERAKLKSFSKNNMLLGKKPDDIDDMINLSLINVNTRKLKEFSLMYTDKYARELFLTSIKDSKKLKLRNIKKTLKMAKQLRISASEI